MPLSGSGQARRYAPETGEWGVVRYMTAAPIGEGWVGLSEIAAHRDWLYVVEHDNHIGEAAATTKLVTRVPLSELVSAPFGGKLPLVTREVVVTCSPTCSPPAAACSTR